MRRSIRWLPLATLLLVPPSATRAQTMEARYARAEQFLSWNVRKLAFKLDVVPHWIGGGDRFWYRNETRTGKEFVLVDPATGVRRPAFDHDRLATALSLAADTSYRPGRLPFDTINVSQDGRTISFELRRAPWRCDLGTYRCERTGNVRDSTAAPELLSPDGRWAAFVREHNLYVRSTSTNQVRALTTDGAPHFAYAASPEARTTFVTELRNGVRLPPVARWSPDSKRLITHRLDERNVSELALIQSARPDGNARPRLFTYRYPLVGDTNLAHAQLVIVDVEQGAVVPVQLPSVELWFLTPIELNDIWWSADGARAYFIQPERSERALHLRVIDAHTGASREVLEERGATYLETTLEQDSDTPRPNIRSLRDTETVIWFSERDGYGHLYRYDAATGALRNQITRGEWVVRNIEFVDEVSRQIYFTGAGREGGLDPYFRFLYRVGFDGTGLQRLTSENADHAITFTPSGRFFIDVYSRVDTVPLSVLRRSDGSVVRLLEAADLDALLATGWRWPERVTIKARDGKTDLSAVLYKPTNFDPRARYPVVDDTYPGPQSIRAPTRLDGKAFRAQPVAELGFVVITIDGLGTPLRSKAFHDYGYGRMEDAGGIADHVVALQQLARDRPYLDLERVGIYGHSGGGYASARAILAFPQFYKVAVSSAGNHDQRGYLAMWGEKYQGPLDSSRYAAQANVPLAANLTGHLLLAAGELDDNVHPAMTLQLADALVKANKTFDMLILPNQNHSFLRDPYFTRRLWDYFVQHLLGERPPTDYLIKPPGS